MNPKIKIALCMTSDFAYDQRMQKIAGSLCSLYDVKIFHRPKKVQQLKYHNLPFFTFFKKGIFFYLEFNFRLLISLLFFKGDAIYCVDTDTLLSCGLASMLKRKILIFDSHEYFVATPELENKYTKRMIWKSIERWFVPHTKLCITVNDSLATILSHEFNKPFIAIKNVPLGYESSPEAIKENVILYQGVINKGRGLEPAIEAMQYVSQMQLVIAGRGDLDQQIYDLVHNFGVESKVQIVGVLSPDELQSWTKKAKLGLNLLDDISASYYYSLANKFFDYMHALTPSINMDFPEYRAIISEYKVGVLINTLEPKAIAEIINQCLQPELYDTMRQECVKASQHYQWATEEKKLLAAMQLLFKNHHNETQ